MIWIYGLGIAFLHGGYVDLMRSRGAAQGLNTMFELIGGLAYLVFFIWGFFVFDWWVPLVMPIVAMIAATMVTSLILNIPHLFILLGSGLCLFSIMSSRVH